VKRVSSSPSATTERHPSERDRQETTVRLSAADFAALIDELEALRRELEAEGRKPSAAATGAEHLVAALERAGVGADTLEQVATLIAVAATLETVATDKDGAGPGAIVRVTDRAGRAWDYELTGEADVAEAPEPVSIYSPIGRALLGSRPGEHVLIPLADGRPRRVHVVTVQPPPGGSFVSALTGGTQS
jgi:transcription elongation GreA/GreB family factor